MKKPILLTLFLLIVAVGISYAQVVVSGTITSSEDNSVLPGVTIIEKGSSNGTVTDVNGKYTLRVNEGATLVFSFTGMTPIEEAIGSRTSIDVAMGTDDAILNEVVVTAFGMEKEKKALGYSATEIDGDELTTAKEVSVVTQLAGKVAGLDITKPTTGPAGSTNIVIRGLSTLNGDNRALIVVDGVPVDNSNLGSAGMWGGIDTGDGISSINADDIESINVLKGAAAGALYGERGAQGVILITTKKGTKRKGIGLEYSSNYTTDKAALYPDFYQREYGQGQNGQIPQTQEEAAENSASWGGKLDGRTITYFDGVDRPYSARPEDDILNYYRTGYTWTNTIAMTGGSETATARLSLSNLKNEGIVPNSGYERYSVNLLTSLNLTDNFTVELKANYVDEGAVNRANLSDNPSNPGKAWSQLPINISNEMLEDNLRFDDGRAVAWSSSNPFTVNPYWGPFEHRQNDQRRRVIGYVLAKYNFTDWLSLQARYALDWQQRDEFYAEAPGTEHNVNGSIGQTSYQINDNTKDIVINIDKRISDDFGVNLNLGGVQNPRSRRRTNVSGSGFVVPGLFTVRNLSNRNPGDFEDRELQTNGLYATALFDYKRFLYLDGTIRQDWYSTLTSPTDPDASDNTAVYGGASLSFIFSEIMNLPKAFTFGKIRASYGTAGNGVADPYLLSLTYGIDPIAYNGASLGSINTEVFPSQNLKPTITTSFEVGADLRFFRNRFGIDFTYYKQNSRNQLLEASIPRPTAYARFLLNAGDIENKGIELAVSATPVIRGDFRWDLSMNYARNSNRVLALADGIDNFSGESARFNANLISEVGEQVNTIHGTVLMKNDAGQIVHDENGLPMFEEENGPLGNYAPDWYGGLSSTFTFKNISLGLLFDTKQGGEIYSLTNVFAISQGSHPLTLVGRDNPDFVIQGEGVGPDGVTANAVSAPLDDYYGRLANAASESIFDASYIKLRQVTLTYRFTDNMFKNVPINGASISLTGRNLFFLQNKLDVLGLDPEAVYNLGGSGFEYSSIPSTRTFGVSLNVKL